MRTGTVTNAYGLYGYKRAGMQRMRAYLIQLNHFSSDTTSVDLLQ